jgi:hypothetical protein
MSEDTLQDKPPAAQMRDDLKNIVRLLQGITAHQEKLSELGLLMADARDTVTEAVGVFHSQGMDLQQGMEVLLQRVAAKQEQDRPRGWRRPLPVWMSVAVLGGVLTLTSLGVWWRWPSTQYHALAVRLDQVLAEQYGSLPKGVQERLTAIYGQEHIQAPGQRQGGKGK